MLAPYKIEAMIVYYASWEYSYIIIPIRATKIKYQPLTYYI